MKWPSCMRDEIYSPEYTRLREVLRRERKKAGLKQSEIAKKTNRSQAYVSKFENGDLRLDVIDFVRFCGVIGCDPHTILKEVFSNSRLYNTEISSKPEKSRDVAHTFYGEVIEGEITIRGPAKLDEKTLKKLKQIGLTKFKKRPAQIVHLGKPSKQTIK